jgi:hypothetical protein
LSELAGELRICRTSPVSAPVLRGPLLCSDPGSRVGGSTTTAYQKLVESGTSRLRNVFWVVILAARRIELRVRAKNAKPYAPAENRSLVVTYSKMDESSDMISNCDSDQANSFNGANFLPRMETEFRPSQSVRIVS